MVNVSTISKKLTILIIVVNLRRAYKWWKLDRTGWKELDRIQPHCSIRVYSDHLLKA